MRIYNDLSLEEQEQARGIALGELLDAVVKGAIRFNDELNHDDLQARIDAAVAQADAMQTPWFASEYVLDAARDDLEGMAAVDAEDAFYPAPDERIIELPHPSKPKGPSR